MTRSKAIVLAVSAALMSSGAAYAQKVGGIDPEGPSNGGAIEGPGALPGFTCSGQGGTNCSIAIPDNTPAGITSSFNLSGCGEILDVDVGLDITHTWIGDLTVTVTSPQGTPVTLYGGGGLGCSGDDMFAVLDDAAPSPVESECAAQVPAIEGYFTPVSPLSALDGETSNGTWSLNVADNFALDTGTLNNWSVDVFSNTCGSPDADAGAIARFAVDKVFNDGNPGDVEVTISCNTGLPLEQSDDISQGDGVVFVVTDFNNGEMDCEITETVPAGYSVNYNDGSVNSSTSCQYDDVVFERTNSCTITNTLLTVDVDVTKEWIDENPQFEAIDYAEANYGCSGAQFGSNPYGQLEFVGNPGFDSFSVYPHWNGGTTCWVTEQFVETGVESDDSDCSSLSVTPGNGASCTIVNTRLYEGIPTLSQYGLGLLALLMLGMGFVAFRRFA